MKPLVLGDGLLGNEIVKQTNWDYISRKKDGIDVNNFNSWSHRILHKMLSHDTIINCIANTNTYSQDKELHWKTNYEFVDVLVNFCNENKKKLIHISTDHVYTNSKNQASELDVPVHMETWYGYTKLLGDAHVQLKSKNYLIVRESHKPYPFPYKVAWWDQHTNGDYVNIIADLIIKLIHKNATGIFNVGTEEKTWYDLTKDEFKTVPGAKFPDAPYNITMNLNKLHDNIL